MQQPERTWTARGHMVRMGRGSLKNLVNGMPVGMVIGDKTGRVVVWNEAVSAFLTASGGDDCGPLRPGEPLACAEGDGCSGPEPCSRCQLASLLDETLAEGGPVRRVLDVRVGPPGARLLRRFRVHGSLVPSDRETLVSVIVRDLDAVLADITHEGTTGIGRLTGSSAPMRELKSVVLEVAESRAPVLILGESGTGKELVARALHDHSDRREELFVPVNCGALPEGLLETELFGHVRGSFTGAVRDKRGRFELAHRGTLFLDEVAELSPQLQVKLLRVLQDGTFNRVGDESPTTVDVRLLAATNRDLHTEMAEGRFRPDLFYRLAVVPIEVPPLRERVRDIPVLAMRLLERIAAENGRIAPEIDPQTFELLASYPWPGNVRELENALHFALIRAKGRSLLAEHLPGHVRHTASLAGLPRRYQRLTLETIRDALEQAGGNRSEAARRLGVSRATLYRHLARLARHTT